MQEYFSSRATFYVNRRDDFVDIQVVHVSMSHDYIYILHVHVNKCDHIYLAYSDINTCMLHVNMMIMYIYITILHVDGIKLRLQLKLGGKEEGTKIKKNIISINRFIRRNLENYD